MSDNNNNNNTTTTAATATNNTKKHDPHPQNQSAAPSPAPTQHSPIMLRPADTLDATGTNPYSPTQLPTARDKMQKLKKNPLVPIGAIATGMVLFAGLFAFRSGNAALSQKLMRARVFVQGATLGVLATSVAGGVVAAKRGSGGG